MSIKFQLTKEEVQEIESQKKYYENYRAISIEALKIVQKKRGWVSDQAIYAISEILQMNPSEIEGIATFYSQIFRQPVGRNIIRYCDSVVCFLTGYEIIKTTLENSLKIKTGETSKDNRFTLLPVCCLGNCDKAPTLMINEDTYSFLNAESIKHLLELYK
ncbi:NADH dehydrogenase [Buchnera aphidicola (Diuraphis noxia)]|uniref:NADH-quinone oxidoreductase subunit E n=1 Tax=Buchnera aphidicola subsp. Diuraphis noxia TaxID=118101 RepID=A0A1B2H833_BUCDN|nr:NADH-quinone oxidoreductase subunit NuoE [Buchnera aphidicola]ANZ22387.1 NADH dehydrogenase [Buchnera aphidicola (Diuraphis noxia)]